jgi:acyl-CoA synthetase (AMP-forming)/AMP-acid ligase II
MTSLCHLINQQAALRPQAVYVMDADSEQALDYAALLSSSAGIGQVLQGLGLSAGDTISVIMPNGLNTLRILLGGMWSGHCVNPVNLLAQTEQMRYVLEHSDCKLVIASPEWGDMVQGLLKTIERPIQLLVVGSAIESLPGETALTGEALNRAAMAAEAVVWPERHALLMYTSGTTGVPKGVLLTQAQLAHNARSIAAEHHLSEQDRVMAVLPLYHINAFVVTMLAPLVSGSSLALAARFSVGRFWKQVSDRRCTWINLVPTMVSYLLEQEAPSPAITAALRFCRSASASLPPEHLLGFEKKFGIGVIETMGLTETAAPSFSNPLERAERKLGSVGKATGCEARVVDDQCNPLPDGETGEVVIMGGNVMAGYYKNPTATAAALTPDGWLRTGDLGHRDADGFFFITGRIKELIIKGGENIAPREIDEMLLRHPDVLDAASVGVPDKHYGQEIMACIVLRPGCQPSETDIRTFCETHLGRFKTPKLMHFVTDLPRGPSGKVQRLKLPEFVESFFSAAE